MARSWVMFVLGGVVVFGAMLGAREDHVDQAGPQVKVLSSVEIKEALDGAPTNATSLEVTFEPGVAGLPHRHPGPIFGYVLEGELEFQAGEGEVQKLKEGDTFYEPKMALHAVSRNPSKTATTRILAVMLHPRDAHDMVIPEPPPKNGK